MTFLPGYSALSPVFEELERSASCILQNEVTSLTHISVMWLSKGDGLLWGCNVWPGMDKTDAPARRYVKTTRSLYVEVSAGPSRTLGTCQELLM